MEEKLPPSLSLINSDRWSGTFTVLPFTFTYMEERKRTGTYLYGGGRTSLRRKAQLGRLVVSARASTTTTSLSSVIHMCLLALLVCNISYYYKKPCVCPSTLERKEKDAKQCAHGWHSSLSAFCSAFLLFLDSLNSGTRAFARLPPCSGEPPLTPHHPWHLERRHLGVLEICDPAVACLFCHAAVCVNLPATHGR